MHGRGERGAAFHEGEGAGFGGEFEAVKGAVEGGHAFVDAVQVVVSGVEMEPRGVGLAGVVAGELGEVVGVVGVGQVEGRDDAIVG